MLLIRVVPGLAFLRLVVDRWLPVDGRRQDRLGRRRAAVGAVGAGDDNLGRTCRPDAVVLHRFHRPTDAGVRIHLEPRHQQTVVKVHRDDGTLAGGTVVGWQGVVGTGVAVIEARLVEDVGVLAMHILVREGLRIEGQVGGVRAGVEGAEGSADIPASFLVEVRVGGQHGPHHGEEGLVAGDVAVGAGGDEVVQDGETFRGAGERVGRHCRIAATGVVSDLRGEADALVGLLDVHRHPGHMNLGPHRPVGRADDRDALLGHDIVRGAPLDVGRARALGKQFAVVGAEEEVVGVHGLGVVQNLDLRHQGHALAAVGLAEGRRVLRPRDRLAHHPELAEKGAGGARDLGDERILAALG